MLNPERPQFHFQLCTKLSSGASGYVGWFVTPINQPKNKMNLAKETNYDHFQCLLVPSLQFSKVPILAGEIPIFHGA
jgi:hypothetical protein